MNYELALKLKEAGFPLKGVSCHECDEGRIRLDGGEVTLYAPTLEELIEACGKINDEEQKFILWFTGTNWAAGYYEYGDENYVDSYPRAEYGSTPTEAVAYLWLALNSK